MIKCRPIDPILIRTHGDLIFLEAGKARALADAGKVTYEGHKPMAFASMMGMAPEAIPVVKVDPKRAQPVECYLQRSGWRPHRAGKHQPRVLWIQDRSKLGGAELSNDTVVRVGESLGFDIVSVSPPYFPQHLFNEADFAIVNNVHEFNADQAKAIQLLLFESRLPYVKYEHDLRELKRLNIARPLFSRARLSVFISPAHCRWHKEAIDIGAHTELPLAIDTDFYQRLPSDAVRDDKTVVPTPHKCGMELNAFIATRIDKEYLLIGDRGGLVIPKGAKVTGLPAQSPEKMRQLFAEHALVVHLPERCWAGERVVLEAVCCGAETVTNGNVGHASWNPMPDRAALAKAPYMFWSQVEAACTSQ